MLKFIAIGLCFLLPSAVLTQPQTSPAKNSYQAVTSHLDSGGNLYLYLSVKEWLSGLSGQISQLRNLVSALPNTSDAERQTASRTFDMLENLIEHSGVEQISGFGMSSVEVGNGLYRSRAMLHHDRGNNAGYIWSLFGREPHALNGLDLLPANTVFASFTDLDPALLWSVLNKEVGQSKIPDVEQTMQGLRTQFTAMTGLDLNTALESLGGECGLVMTLDETGNKNAILPETSMKIPQISLMVVCRVRNDTIFDTIDSTLKTNPLIVRTNRSGLRMRTMLPPFPGPFNLRPSVARSGDYLFLASNDTLIEASLAVMAGTQLGIKSTDEFKKLSQGVPDQGNSFTFRSSKVTEMIAQLQSDILGANPATNNFNQAQVLTNLFGARGTAGSYRVAANTDEGWLFTGNSGQNPATTFLLLPTMAVTGMVATVAIPSLVRSRQAANETAAVANLRKIAEAEMKYSSSSRGNYADLPSLMTAGLVDSRLSLPVSGYQISITASGRNYTATATPTSPNSGRYGYFITTEGVVRYSKETTLAPLGLSGKPVQ